MPVAASSFLTLSLWLAVIIGPQMRMWPWGPALIALAAALTCAAISALRTRRPVLGPGTLAIGVMVTAWFAWRAWTSPVAELAHADLLLLGAAVGCFLVVRTIAHDRRAEAVFLWGLAGLLAASTGMIAMQLGEPEFSQFRGRAALTPSGFYAQYNEGANFLIGAGFLLLGGAMFGKQHLAVRILWMLIAVLGLAAVWFTRSRGAVFGVIIGCAALGSLLLVIGSKRKAAWFAPAAIAFPIILLASGFLLFFGWEKMQRIRSGGKAGVVEMMDNTSRLRNYSLSYDAIALHPISGGGSRSFSWNSLQLWNPDEHGLARNLPEQTHNEILQAATDYGLPGAGGILILLGWLSLRALWHSKFDEENPAESSVSADALRLGGMAALAGMLVQSSFSFVFHLLPGVMLLGIALGRLATPSAQSPAVCRTGRSAAVILSLGIAAAMIWPGLAGMRATAPLMPVYFRIGPEPDQVELIERYSRAIDAWPQSDLYASRAMVHHLAIGSDRANLGQAFDDYLAAARHHPKFPGHFVNAANLKSAAGDADKAEVLFHQAIKLQGNMEPAFHAHFHLAAHLLRRGTGQLRDGDANAALITLQSALEHLENVEKKSAWIADLHGEYLENRRAIHRMLALSQEAVGDAEGAKKTLEAILGIRGNDTLRYDLGMLEFRHANSLWHQRQPEAALPGFQHARDQLLRARNHPPDGISVASIDRQIHEIDDILKLLKNAGFHAE